MGSAQAVLADLRHWGQALGFSQIGVSGIDLSSAEPGLVAWLHNGWHGTMDYMAAHGLKRARPAELVPGTLSVITARMDYLPPDTPADWREREAARLQQPDRAVVSLYARGRDYHKVLRQRLQRLADRLAESVGPFGHRVFTDSAPVLEVELAGRSGLGWRGKHTLALDRDAGSMFFLGEIFTDLPLPPTAPVEPHCGQCSACLDACPTQAIVAPGRLDARRCISYLTIEHDGPIPEALRPALGNRIYGCDDCQRVCPWNKYAKVSALPDFAVRAPFADPTLLALWRWDEAEFLRRTEGSAIRRIGHQRWRRNLAVALGNALGQRDWPEARAALEAALPTASALVAQHIAWALAPPGQRASSTGVPVAAKASSASGTLASPSSVDSVTSPATKPPSPPSRAAST
ncbi:tRNA epoxyqueuosine(34) reductase QueG [Aquabacterium sp. J223]|uniref:tRNA epoxyqueuosine(34) reductase QueG n=1 Tax=Aquabacterium sp. J223 TaxID=2898431 RepID=UPI0021ADE3AF|nr:tRNA epoxyqueuosine(34) reductase QueG [Aquabacterium sp. J223]UUX94028.1 tRNA epoxyqueuosine(34) reductase QueG [Aquabacterium sp. J223]